MKFLYNHFVICILAVAPLLSQPAPLQTTAPTIGNVKRVAPHATLHLNTYYRVIAVVPIIGKGTMDDPRRPQYAPFTPLTARPSAATPRSGIIAFTHITSDDGKNALVEFVGGSRAALLPILNDKSVVSFEKAKHSRSEIEKELKKYSKKFTFDTFGVPVL